MAGTAAEDARVFTEARVALKRLIGAGDRGATGVSLLGDAFRGRWGSSFMRRLEAAGLVQRRALSAEERRGRVGTPPVVFVAALTEDLQTLVDDDEQLASVLWPATGLSRVAPQAGHTETEESEPEDESSDLPGLDEGEPSSPLEVLRAIFVYVQAIAANTVYMRDKIEKVERDVAKLREAWE